MAWLFAPNKPMDPACCAGWPKAPAACCWGWPKAPAAGVVAAPKAGVEEPKSPPVAAGWAVAPKPVGLKADCCCCAPEKIEQK